MSAQRKSFICWRNDSYFCRNRPGARRGEKQVRYAVIISRASCEPHTGTCSPPAARSNSNSLNYFVTIDLFTAQRAQPETTALLTEWRDVSVGPGKGKNPKGLWGRGVGGLSLERQWNTYTQRWINYSSRLCFLGRLGGETTGLAAAESGARLPRLALDTEHGLWVSRREHCFVPPGSALQRPVVQKRHTLPLKMNGYETVKVNKALPYLSLFQMLNWKLIL